MADVERTLISKTLQTGGMPDVIAAGFETDHFADDECREVWDYMLDFQREHKSSPSPAVVKEEFPRFKLIVNRDPLSYHMERFELKVKERTAIDLVRDYHDAIEDPDQLKEIELRALDMARQLTEILPASRASKFSDGKRRKDEYERREKTGDVHGIYLGVPTLDEEMLGIQAHEMLCIAAYMGVGKSTMMQHIAYSAYLQGKTVLYISLEMEESAIMRKIDVMASKIKYHALKAVQLDTTERKQWEKILEQAEKDKHERDIIVRDNIKNCTVDHVMAEAMRYKPDIVMVDYLELMRVPKGAGAQHWEQVSYSGMGLKQNARVMKIPHITAAQLNREGGKEKVSLANVGYQSIGKHSDLMIGLMQDEEMESQQEMDVILLKNRDGKKARARMRWMLERMDIHEKGVDERFPVRPNVKSLIGRERRKKQRLAVKSTVAGKDNPFSQRKAIKKKPNPWTAKVAA